MTELTQDTIEAEEIVYVPVNVKDELPERNSKVLAKSEYGDYKITNGYHVQSNHCTHWLKPMKISDLTKACALSYEQKIAELEEKNKKLSHEFDIMVGNDARQEILIENLKSKIKQYNDDKRGND